MIYIILPIWANGESHYDLHKLKVVIVKISPDGSFTVGKKADSKYKYDYYSSSVSSILNSIKVKEPDLIKINSNSYSATPNGFVYPNVKNFKCIIKKKTSPNGHRMYDYVVNFSANPIVCKHLKKNRIPIAS